MARRQRKSAERCTLNSPLPTLHPYPSYVPFLDLPNTNPNPANGLHNNYLNKMLILRRSTRHQNGSHPTPLSKLLMTPLNDPVIVEDPSRLQTVCQRVYCPPSPSSVKPPMLRASFPSSETNPMPRPLSAYRHLQIQAISRIGV